MKRKVYRVTTCDADSPSSIQGWMNDCAKEGFVLSSMSTSGSATNYHHTHKATIVMEKDG